MLGRYISYEREGCPLSFIAIFETISVEGRQLIWLGISSSSDVHPPALGHHGQEHCR